MPGWTIITNYGLVLAYIARHPEHTVREIAGAVSITEWTVHKIINELETEGYLERKRVGRNNAYSINPSRTLRHETMRHVMVGDLLKVLGWESEEAAAKEKVAEITVNPRVNRAIVRRVAGEAAA